MYSFIQNWELINKYSLSIHLLQSVLILKYVLKFWQEAHGP